VFSSDGLRVAWENNSVIYNRTTTHDVDYNRATHYDSDHNKRTNRYFLHLSFNYNCNTVFTKKNQKQSEFCGDADARWPNDPVTLNPVSVTLTV